MTLPKRWRVSARERWQSSSRYGPAAGEINEAKSASDHFPPRTQRRASASEAVSERSSNASRASALNSWTKLTGKRLAEAGGNNKSSRRLPSPFYDGRNSIKKRRR